jgi:hypothetical protein
MPPPSALALEARQAAWSRLWQVLLREPSSDDVEQQESVPSSESSETNDAAARASSGKEAMPVA